MRQAVANGHLGIYREADRGKMTASRHTGAIFDITILTDNRYCAVDLQPWTNAGVGVAASVGQTSPKSAYESDQLTR